VSFFSRDSAEELAQKIRTARDNNTSFDLSIVLIRAGEEEEDGGTYQVREVRHAHRLSSGMELIHCETVAGNRKIEILFPSPDMRQIDIAEILIDDGD
jgi:hypothetical protein